MLKTTNLKLGQFGESIAKKYLKQKGYKFIDSNYRSRGGEIDLICKTGETLIFVEVKTRSNIAFGYPEEAITKQKRQHLFKAAEKFLLSRPQKSSNMRFDAISIIVKNNRPAEIKHLQNIIQDLNDS